MRKIHDVLRLHAVGLSKRRIAVGLSKRRIAVGLNIGRTAVGDYLRRARRAGLAWPPPEELSDEALERLLFAPPPVLSPDRRPLPDWPLLHRELKRPGVTLSLLWEEYRAVHRDGYGDSRFCDLYRASRRLDKALFQQLARGKWIAGKQNLIVTGLCGVGKSWLACALGQKTCRDDFSVLYKRVPRMFAELETGRADGRYPRLFRALTKANLPILDDWGPDRLSADQRRDLMEIVEDRYQNAAILITSQLPVDKWHDVIGEPTFADAILDRIVHNAHRINLDGPSMRKTIAENFNANDVDHAERK